MYVKHSQTPHPTYALIPVMQEQRGKEAVKCHYYQQAADQPLSEDKR
jgi:hypothetical protein